MKYVNVKIAETYAKQIDPYVDCGVYSSRAEVVRVALKDLLEKLQTHEVIA